jgi:hypothetical protein
MKSKSESKICVQLSLIIRLGFYPLSLCAIYASLWLIYLPTKRSTGPFALATCCTPLGRLGFPVCCVCCNLKYLD